MKEDDITVYLQQFSLDQLEDIQKLVEKKAEEKKRRQSERARSHSSFPPSPPKDIAALAEAADLDISGLMRDIGRRKR
ncbi:hypothetical protein [Marinobacterium mangrovicola]|uniref:Uncharacterized protein n=1 Tax=Marinobacterium mangrovicola TaxID=1476959 RepID=A0A4R1GAN7_9GAMM|nr:hypothetical protein [Marinobacterium mangrovicola]TCK02709.1 hypothetical protein CLV83_4406 [Marinobacterium mangrovicola]